MYYTRIQALGITSLKNQRSRIEEPLSGTVASSGSDLCADRELGLRAIERGVGRIARHRDAGPSGALVPAAVITVENAVTSLTRTVPTDDAGEYRVASLPPGEYKVKVQKRGFRTQVSSGVRITVGQIAVLESKLEPGVDNEIVMVTSQAPMVESERSHQAETLQQEWIQNLPINRRDYLDLHSAGARRRGCHRARRQCRFPREADSP